MTSFEIDNRNSDIGSAIDDAWTSPLGVKTIDAFAENFSDGAKVSTGVGHRHFSPHKSRFSRLKSRELFQPSLLRIFCQAGESAAGFPDDALNHFRSLKRRWFLAGC